MNEYDFFKNIRLNDSGFVIVKVLQKNGTDKKSINRRLFFKKVGLTNNNELKIFI